MIKDIQKRISDIKIEHDVKINRKEKVPESFIPWNVDLSPSALYSCSVTCRKSMNIKTPEVKWISVKRWVNVTPMGINLPMGCYLSIKRRETFEAYPEPKFIKQDYALVMFPYGNVWSQQNVDTPITEEWLWSIDNGKTIFEWLLDKDASRPISGYLKASYDYYMNNPDQIGIHLKRKKNLIKDE
jgi:hypothetical protein